MTAVLEHLTTNAPALAGDAIDYRALLRDGLEQLDVYDSRSHLATVSGSELAHDIRVRAGALAAAGLGHGDRIILVAANDRQYLASVLGALLLGAVPCAVAPPPTPGREHSGGVQHLRAAIATVNPKVVIAPPQIGAAVVHPQVLTFEELAAAQPLSLSVPSAAGPDDVHHIQLTSGSTSAPKAVLLTHRNVVHNVSALTHGTGVTRGRERVFSWLPLYHDMGFVQVLAAVLYGLPIGLMTPMGFLRDPLSWVRHMTHHRSTHTAGPPFAYQAAVDALTRLKHTPADIELSTLQYAYIGAEPIPYSVVREFTEAFAPLGIRPDVLVPCYGMAETVLATTVAIGATHGARRDFGRVGIQHDHVGCGRPLDGLRLRIVTTDGTEAQPGEVGDIWVSGPSVMAGYQAPDGSVQAPRDGWHDTGDRGFLCSGELYVVGRSKEMLIVRGRNFPPYDVERAIDSVPDVSAGLSVVFSLADPGRARESVVTVAGTKLPAAEHDRLRGEIAAAVRGAFGFSPDDVVLVPVGAIPRTTSGKRQRVKVREMYQAGQLGAATR